MCGPFLDPGVERSTGPNASPHFPPASSSNIEPHPKLRRTSRPLHLSITQRPISLDLLCELIDQLSCNYICALYFRQLRTDSFPYRGDDTAAYEPNNPISGIRATHRWTCGTACYIALLPPCDKAQIRQSPRRVPSGARGARPRQPSWWTIAKVRRRRRVACRMPPD